MCLRCDLCVAFLGSGAFSELCCVAFCLVLIASLLCNVGGCCVQDYNEVQNVQLTELIALTRTNLTRADRTRVMVMVTMDAHARDIIAGLVKGRIMSPTAFQWQSQLKQRLQVHSTDVHSTDVCRVC